MSNIEALRKGIETFHVPQDDGYNVFTITFTVYADGSITLPTDLTPRQSDALRAYLTYDNQHMRELRGAHLDEMPEAQSVLLDTVLDSLKTPEQVERERITAWVLQQHIKQVSTYKPFVSWFEENDYHKKDWIADGKCDQDDTIYDVHITESYDGTFSYRHNQVTTLYFLAVKPDSSITVMHSRVEKQVREEEE